MDAISVQSVALISEFQSQNISNIAWAIATLEY